MKQSKTAVITAAKKLRDLIETNLDGRMYFFAKADTSWFGWLWGNGFLDILKQKAQDQTQYRYSTPEIGYLERMAQEIPDKVVDFMLSFQISKENFNPEVIDRFLRICRGLPAAHLSRIVPKIQNEKWTQLMHSFNVQSFDFEDMLDTLIAAKDDANLIALAEAVLAIRAKEEIKQSLLDANIFFIENMAESEIFEKLANIHQSAVEGVLKVAAHALGEAAILGGSSEDGVFKIKESFSLYDVDFFTLTVGENRLSRRTEAGLAAVVSTLARRSIESSCEDSDKVKDIFKNYIEPLPDSRTMWRLRLFIWSLCPNVFQDELHQAFLRLFDDPDRAFQIAGGAEYKRALKKTFSILSEEDRRAYIGKLFKTFPKKEASFAWNIFRSIQNDLTPEEKNLAESTYERKFDDLEYQPEPTLIQGRSGVVIPQAPPEADFVFGGPVPGVVEILKTGWGPEALREKYAEDDFFRPQNAEGVGDQLKNQIKNRLGDYLESAPLFFDRQKLHPHYTYAYLQGLRDAIKTNRPAAVLLDWGPFFNFTNAVIESGTREAFNPESRERDRMGWLANWESVHNTLADTLEEVLHVEDDKVVANLEIQREDVLRLLGYLFTFPDPVPEDERIETATTKIQSAGASDYQVADPYTIAINSVRGHTFQALLQFIFLDGKKYPTDAKIKIADDAKALYEHVLKVENTRAIRFMFGHHLAFFYYRDQAWIKGLLQDLFPKDETKKTLRSATWEGYITASIYEELFTLLHEQYRAAIHGVFDQENSDQRHFAHDEDPLAIHLALAYVHFHNFKLNSDLFVDFWKESNPQRLGAFVSFIGRHAVSRSSQERWFIEGKMVIVKKLQDLWDWILAHCDEPEVFSEFGYWIATQQNIFEIPWLADHIERSLQKAKGSIDWDIGLEDSLVDFADKAPMQTVRILRLVLIEGGQKEAWIYARYMDKLQEPLKRLYADTDPAVKESAYQLINDLLPLGNGRFWDLKEIVS